MNGNTGDALGRSITDACRFLTQIYKDTSEMLAGLDGLLFDHDWLPTEKTRTSWALSNGNKPNRWLLEYLFRWYRPKRTELANMRSMLAFLVRFAPLGIDQPIVLGAAASFPSAPRYRGLKKHWRKSWKGFDPILDRLRRQLGVTALTKDEAEKLLPGAGDVTGLVVPLCHLTGTDALLSHCVKPVLATASNPE